jgi:hypothetical protein
MLNRPVYLSIVEQVVMNTLSDAACLCAASAP